MPSKFNFLQTNQKVGKTIAALVLDGYRQYCEFGYPNDPKVYVIRAEALTLKKVEDYLKSLYFTNGEKCEFQFQRDSRMLSGQVMFGPEQIEIRVD